MNNNVKIFISGVVVLIISIVAMVSLRGGSGISNVPGKYDAFAVCLKDKGAVFYGAFWCPHCQAQKKELGSSAKLLPYIECSTLDGKNQTQICKDKKIEGYPTWEFSDGSRLTGKVEISKLAEKTECVVPE